MGRLSMWPAVLGLAMAMVLVVLIEPVKNSLAYASGLIVIIGLIGWVLEAREVAGPAPAVEPEHEEEEPAPGPSYWPVVLALGIVGIAAGLIYDWEYGALLVALPLALGAGGAWALILSKEMTPTPEEREAALLGPPLPMPGGRTLLPVPPNALAAQAAGGAAIALERVETNQVSRRGLLRITFWSGLGAGLLAATASIVDFLYPRGITGFGSVVDAGTVDEFELGVPTPVQEGKFWLVNLTEAQGGPGFLALWWKCPHLGCTVPWRPTFNFNGTQGWFRCPCHGSTYTAAGVRVFGPAPRSMDRMEVTIAGGRISVNTGSIEKGTPDNPSFAVQG